MNGFYIALAASPILLLITVVFLAVIVTGIRKGDRDDLRTTPRNRVDSITRRVVSVGIRNESGKGDDQ